MRPPRTPDHESDEIVDMTPDLPPDEDTSDIVDMTPDLPEYEGDSDVVDMTPAYVPEEDEIEERTVAAPSTTQEEHIQRSAERERAPARVPRRAPQRSAEQPPPRSPTATPAPIGTVPPPPKPPAGNRWKRILIVIAALVVVAFVGKTLGQALVGIVGFGGNRTSQTTPGASSTSTPQTAQIGGKTITTSPGALILLNPGVVRQGTRVGVTGAGFDPGAVIDLTVMRQGTGTALSATFVQADKSGTFANAALGVPMSLSSGTFVVEAKERNSTNAAQAIGTIAGGAPTVKLGTQVGKPGDNLVLGLHGFAPGETVNVYWNTLSGQPVTKFQADGGGSIGQGKIQVPFGAVGENTFLFVGQSSQSLVAATFLVLQLYPSVKLGSYALKADNVMSYSGSGFGPGERVFVFLNSMMSQPLAVITTDAKGSFKNVPGFIVPFQIKGKQTLIFMGEQSRAPDAVNFTVLPYSPIVQPSTYGGFPGTTISFYASGFAHNEVVHVYAGHTKSTMGNMVACFQTDDKGAAAAVGSYMIPGDAQGAVGFALVGARSGGIGVASVNVTAPPVPVHTPAQPPFTCPLDPPPPSQQQQQQQQQQPQQQQQQQPQQQQQQQQPQQQQNPAPAQGRVTQPGTQMTVPPVGYVSFMAATTHDSASVSIESARWPAVTHSGSSSVQADRQGMALGLSRDAWSSLMGRVRIGPLVFGLGIVWFVIVVGLNIALLWRSTREKATRVERADRENAAIEGRSPALVTASSVQLTEGEQTEVLRAGMGSVGCSLAAQSPVPATVCGRVPARDSPAVSPVGRRNSQPVFRAARCTLTWHGAGGQPGHDATLVRTGVLPGSEGTACGIFLVADGRRGGEESGNSSGAVVASQFAVEHIARRVIAVTSDGSVPAPSLVRSLFKYAVIQAGDALVARNAAHHTDHRTTVTGALVIGERAYIVNVGNSRTYMFGPSAGLWQITRDHSVVYGMVSAGLVRATALDVSPRAQQLYRSLGDADQPMRVDTYALSILPGDQILLCSDGLWRNVGDSEIEAILRRDADPRETTRELVHTASEHGSGDDISAILVHVLSDD